MRHSRLVTRLLGRADRAVGGRARLRVIALLAAVMGLDGADKGTVAVNASSLESTFGIDHAAIGLLVSVTSLVGAAATLPVGALTDRVDRTRLLGGSVLLWSLVMVVSGAAQSFEWLLASRVALGVLSATAGPTVASLVGDFLPSNRRARLYGFVLAGELVGTGVGYIVSTNIASLLTWRAAFAWLVLPGALLAWAVWRTAEPKRGGQEPLHVRAAREEAAGHEATGDEAPSSEAPGAQPPGAEPSGAEPPGAEAAGAEPAGKARALARRSGEEPVPELVLREDPARMSLWAAARYVLRIRTTVVVIFSSALGYFFFAGVRTFALIYATSHYNISRPTASALVLIVGAGTLAGTLVGGRIADRLLDRGYLNGRILVPAVSFLAVPAVIGPALVTTSPAAAAPLLAVGGALLAIPNPPLDAVRLDTIPAGLWGRAEAVRTAVRTLSEFFAPVLFGYISSNVFHGDRGLEYAFLISLFPLSVGGLLGLVALRTYPRDVATAGESARVLAQRTA